MDVCKQTLWRFGTPKEKNFFRRWGALVLTQEKKTWKIPKFDRDTNVRPVSFLETKLW